MDGGKQKQNKNLNKLYVSVVILVRVKSKEIYKETNYLIKLFTFLTFVSLPNFYQNNNQRNT